MAQMTLPTGFRLGSYEILAAVGAGGMGEVYLSRDPRLGRDVAIKVLPQAFAADTERMARFDREAKLLASLNHPNIASIYGIEDTDSTRALVMEMSQGPRSRTVSARDRFRSTRRCRLRGKLPTRWNTRTSAASCIAI